MAVGYPTGNQDLTWLVTIVGGKNPVSTPMLFWHARALFISSWLMAGLTGIMNGLGPPFDLALTAPRLCCGDFHYVIVAEFCLPSSEALLITGTPNHRKNAERRAGQACIFWAGLGSASPHLLT